MHQPTGPAGRVVAATRSEDVACTLPTPRFLAAIPLRPHRPRSLRDPAEATSSAQRAAHFARVNRLTDPRGQRLLAGPNHDEELAAALLHYCALLRPGVRLGHPDEDGPVAYAAVVGRHVGAFRSERADVLLRLGPEGVTGVAWRGTSLLPADADVRIDGRFSGAMAPAQRSDFVAEAAEMVATTYESLWIDCTRLVDVLRRRSESPEVAPRLVGWLNDTQRFIDNSAGRYSRRGLGATVAPDLGDVESGCIEVGAILEIYRNCAQAIRVEALLVAAELRRRLETSTTSRVVMGNTGDYYALGRGTTSESRALLMGSCGSELRLDIPPPCSTMNELKGVLASMPVSAAAQLVLDVPGIEAALGHDLTGSSPPQTSLGG